MSNLFLTLMIAFVLIVIAIACLAIGWLITGRTRLIKGCGKQPSSKGDCSEQLHCDLCDVESKKECHNLNHKHKS